MAPGQLNELAPQARIDVAEPRGEMAQGRVSKAGNDLVHGLLAGRVDQLGFGDDRAVHGGPAPPAALDQPPFAQARQDGRDGRIRRTPVSFAEALDDRTQGGFA